MCVVVRVVECVIEPDGLLFAVGWCAVSVWVPLFVCFSLCIYHAVADAVLLRNPLLLGQYVGVSARVPIVGLVGVSVSFSRRLGFIRVEPFRRCIAIVWPVTQRLSVV